MVAFLVAVQGDRLANAFVLALKYRIAARRASRAPWDAIDLDGANLTVRQALHEEEGKVFLGPLKTEASYRTITLGEEAIKALRRQRTLQKKERLRAGEKWSLPEVEKPYSPYLVFTNQSEGLMRRTLTASRHLKSVLHRTALVRLANRRGLSVKALPALHEESGGGSIDENQEIRMGDGKIHVVAQGDLLKDVTLHTFRHTHASILIAMGLDPETIAERPGHEVASITLRIYSHMMPGQESGCRDGQIYTIAPNGSKMAVVGG